MQQLDDPAAPTTGDASAAAGQVPALARPFVYVVATGWLALCAVGRLIGRLFAGYLRITDLAGAATMRWLRTAARAVARAVRPLSWVGAAIRRGLAWLVLRVLHPASQWLRRVLERAANRCAPAAHAAHRGVQLIERRTRRVRSRVRTAMTAAASRVRRVAGPPVRAVVAAARRVIEALRAVVTARPQRRP